MQDDTRTPPLAHRLQAVCDQPRRSPPMPIAAVAAGEIRALCDELAFDLDGYPLIEAAVAKAAVGMNHRPADRQMTHAQA